MSTQNLLDEPTLANGPPPWYQSRDDLHTTTQNLADEHTLAQWTPLYQSRHDLHTTTQNLTDEPDFGQCIPYYQSRDDLHTITQNLVDEPTLANASHITRAEMTCIPLHKPWQMNLLWPMDLPPLPEQRWLAYYSSIHHFWDKHTIISEHIFA